MLNLPYLQSTYPLYEVDYDKVPGLNYPALTNSMDILFNLDSIGLKKGLLEIKKLTAKSNSQNKKLISRVVPQLQKNFAEYVENGNIDNPNKNGLSRSVIKMLLAASFSYTDEQYQQELAAQFNLITHASERIVRGFPKDALAMVLAGSLSQAMLGSDRSTWHPFFSDIDLLPINNGLTHGPDSLIDCFKTEAVKISQVKPWLYFNYGAQQGIGCLAREPIAGMYNLSNLDALEQTEEVYLDTMLAGCRTIFFAGDQGIAGQYFSKLNASIVKTAATGLVRL